MYERLSGPPIIQYIYSIWCLQSTSSFDPHKNSEVGRHYCTHFLVGKPRHRKIQTLSQGPIAKGCKLNSDLVTWFRALPNFPWCFSWIHSFLGCFEETTTSEKLKWRIKTLTTSELNSPCEHSFTESTPCPLSISVLSGALVKKTNPWVIPQAIWIEKAYMWPRNLWFLPQMTLMHITFKKHA